MPTLGLLQIYEESQSRPPVTNHGYDSNFFSEVETLFNDIIKFDDEIEVNDKDKIKSKLLQTGPCPGKSRVFYQFTASPNIPGGDDQVNKLLGEDVEITQREAGAMFEDWVDSANEAFNQWLSGEDSTVFDEANIPDKLAEFYKSRVDNLTGTIQRLDVSQEELNIEVQYSVDTELFHKSTPDGVWLPEHIPGGAFESKLSIPPTPVDRHLLAGYAVQIEREKGIPVNFGVYMYLDDDLSKINIENFQIDDVLRSRIRDNIEKFSALGFDSKMSGQWDTSRPLKDRLVEPDEPKYVGNCRSCAYSHTCHDTEDGQYFQLRNEAHKELSNLKLSGAHILPLLDALDQGQPKRSTVADEVMEVFPDKKKKSVFRGMMIPTFRRLKLMRSENDGQRLTLSPNGEAVKRLDSENQKRNLLSKMIRDYLVCDLDITADAIRYFTDKSEILAVDDYSNFDESVSRLQNHYLDYFDVDLPESDDWSESPINTMYDKRELEYLTDEQLRKDWLSSSLVPDQQIQYDKGRSRLLKQLQDSGVNVSSWFVDEAVWREWKSPNRIIDLWEGSTYDNVRLIREGKPYDGILLSRPNRDQSKGD